MKKLQLKLDHLTVESFGTVAPREARGTVAAHSGFTCLAGDYTCRDECTFQGPTCFNQC